ncbi:MAG TPA: class I SAM-dependent methyltransferase [Candidatus Scatomorpha stercorigallinarum]|nr:class I SAM-dependent methyltransferase [Candidatus Scatomorpha stercorigallinarum]
MELREAFVARKGRFRLLDRGLGIAGWAADAPLLEVGCATGEGTAHLLSRGYTHLTAVDIDAAAAGAAARRAPGARIICADARALPLASGGFCGIISEAAFSVIPGKEAAAGEYARVLRRGGSVLLCDFALAGDGEGRGRPGIPCLDGVQSMARYRAIFEGAGFACAYEKEEYGEYIGIAMSLGRAFGVPPAEAGRYIVAAFGKDGYVADFFAHARLTYCQMLFKKV